MTAIKRLVSRMSKMLRRARASRHANTTKLGRKKETSILETEDGAAFKLLLLLRMMMLLCCGLVGQSIWYVLDENEAEAKSPKVKSSERESTIR